jgi:hypothetical protein
VSLHFEFAETALHRIWVKNALLTSVQLIV